MAHYDDMDSFKEGPRISEAATEEEKAAALQKGGIKYDGDKPRFSCIPRGTLLSMARFFTELERRGFTPRPELPPRFDLIPWQPIFELARLYAIGAQKYSPDNWRRGMSWSRPYDALNRHLQAFWDEREDFDAGPGGTGVHHLISVIWNAVALYTYATKKQGTDDRPQAPEKGKGNDPQV